MARRERAKDATKEKERRKQTAKKNKGKRLRTGQRKAEEKPGKYRTRFSKPQIKTR